MIKKILSLALIVVVVFSLTACGKDSNVTTDDKITIYNLKVEIDPALKAYAKTWSEETGIEVEVRSVGAGSDYGAALQSEFQSGNEPDIFVASGPGEFDQWGSVALDMSDQEWVNDTDLEYINENNEVIGFPVAIEGYGLIANTELLEKAGIDYTKVDSIETEKAMFDTLNDKKTDLGIEAPLSFTTKETWVTGNHLFNLLLAGSGSTAEESKEAVDAFIDGDEDALSYDGFGDYSQMLFDNSVGDLSIIDYDTQVSQFTNGKSALLFQGNWALPNIEGADFDTDNLAFIPHMYNENTEGKLPISVPMYYVVNKNTDSEMALQFLNDMAETDAGHDYIVNGAKMIPAFNNVTITPADPLSAQVMEYNKAGNTLPWLFADFPDGYTANTVAPLIDNFYKTGDQDTFIENIKQTAGNTE